MAGVRALVQRVKQAAVTVVEADGERVPAGAIGPGLCAFVGVRNGDGPAAAAKLAAKLWNLRIFPDPGGVMNVSLADAGGSILVVSQFTLYANTERGRRPSFIDAAPPELAEPLIDAVVAALAALGASAGAPAGATVATGRFRTHMEVALVNDGPVTLMIEV